MKTLRILSILLVSAAVLSLAGCQEQQQLDQCRQDNTYLQKQVEEQQIKLEKVQRENEGAQVVILELMKKVEKLSAENTRLKSGQNSAEPADAEKQKKTQPGLQELFKMRQEAAEKMKKEAEK